MNQLEIKETIPCRGEYDVIVAGGGVAGAAAALAASRAGKSVLLIEKTISLGGLATIGLVNLFVPMCNGRGIRIIKGMAEEFLQLSIQRGFDTVPEEWKHGDPGEGAKTRYVTRFSAPVFALALTEILCENGVTLLFDTVISKPVMEGKHCKGVIVENKSGRSFYGAKILVDTTGDADVLYRAGVPTVERKNFHTYYSHGADLESCRRAIELEDIGKLQTSIAGGNANLYGGGHPEDIPMYSGVDAEDVNRYLVSNQRELWNNLSEEDRKTRDIHVLPAMCQFRTTRRIDGDYVMTVEDAYKHFDDSIGAICDFDRRDYLFEVSYGTMICSGFDNLITAGRSAAGEGYAWDVLRVIPPAIITGQAAGLAAAQAIDDQTGIDSIDIKKLQNTLEAADVMIHFDDALIPEDLENSGEFFDVGHQ